MFTRAALAVLLLAGFSAAAASKYPTALAALESQKQLSTFTKLAEYAGLRPHMNSTFGKVTIFAPTNAAIAALATKLKLDPATLGDAEKQLLVDRLVGYHIITRSGALAAKDMKTGLKLRTANNGSLTVTVGAPAAAPAAAPKAAPKPAAAKPAGRRLIELFARMLQATPAPVAVPAAAPMAAVAEPMAAATDAMAAAAAPVMAAVPKPAPKAAAAKPAAAAAPAITITGVQNSAKVVGAPITGGSAIIYPIDAVLLPDTVFATIKDALAFSATTKTLSGLVAKDATLAKASADPTTNVTLFAPVDSAFTTLAAVPAAKALLANPKAVSKILAYHAAAGARVVPSFAANGTETIDTLLANQTVSVTKAVKNGKGLIQVTADSAGAKPVTVRKHNIIAGASLIDVVDGVLVPKL